MPNRTLTSEFIQVLIKGCLLPISLSFDKNIVRFYFCSKPTMIHLLLFCAPGIFAQTLYWHDTMKSGTLSHFLENSSFAEKFSSFAICLIYLKVFLILPLAKQLNYFPVHLIISDQMKFPKYGIWNILGFISMTVGSVLFNIGLQGEHGAGDMLHNLTNHLANLFTASSQSLYWCIFSIVIQVWCETITRDLSQEIIKDSTIFYRNYKQLTAALENYFFYSFATFQLVSIATLFLTCSKLILQVTFYLYHPFKKYNF